MCLAIYKPAGKEVSERHLKNGFEDNPHGAGLAYPENGKLVIHKGWFSFDPFLETFKKVSDLPLLIHFRMMTHGDKSVENCHPFRIDDNRALIHNGIIQISCDHKDYKDASDTRMFADLILKPIFERDPEFAWSGAGRWLIEQAIGFNKIAIMDHEGKALILNEKKGHWFDGVWYSNHSYTFSRSAARASSGNQRYATGVQCGFGSDYEGESWPATKWQNRIPKAGVAANGETIPLTRTADGEGWEPQERFGWIARFVQAGHGVRFGFTPKDLAAIALEYAE